MNKAHLILLILILPIIANSQAAVVKNNSENSSMDAGIAINTLGSNNFKTNDLKYKDVNGTPYLEKNVLTGHIVMMDKKKTEQVPLQYDIYSNEFFHVNDKGEQLVIDLKLVKEIVMHGEEETYIFKRVNPQNPLKFYEVLYETKGLDIYNEMGINFYEGKEQGITKIEPRFSRDDAYFAHQKGEDPKKIKLKKKDLYKFFEKEDQKRMDKITKEQKIKLKKSKDFKRLFEAMKN